MKGRPDVQLLGGKRKDTEGRNEQKNVVDKRETAARHVIARQDIETRKYDVRLQSKRELFRQSVTQTPLRKATSEQRVIFLLRKSSEQRMMVVQEMMKSRGKILASE
jgi:hypothetical protein